MDKAFEKVIMKNSENDTYIEACKEWLCTDYKKGNNYCVCGQKIKNLYKIENQINKKIIFPVGSECAKNCAHLEQSMKDIKHKLEHKNLYCKWCNARHRNKTPVCNLCKVGEYKVNFGKYSEYSYNKVFSINPGFFKFIKEKASHRFCGRLKHFYEQKVAKI